jgi:hypothetical protein
MLCPTSNSRFVPEADILSLSGTKAIIRGSQAAQLEGYIDGQLIF